jgi:hypothetical protein
MNTHEIEFLRTLSAEIIEFNSTRPAASSLKATQHHTQDQSCLTLSMGAAHFAVGLEHANERTYLTLKGEGSTRTKRLAIQQSQPYFETSVRSQIHRSLATIEGWVIYIPKFREWWRSAANAHNHGRANKVSDLRERAGHQLGTYDLEFFDFDYGADTQRYFMQLSFNPDRGYLCMTLNDALNTMFWWNFIVNTGPADDVNAHTAIAECLETLEGFSV